LLTEVGEPFIPYFKHLIQANGLNIETVEVEERPWIYDRLAGD
jgi:hypothetical protein